MIGYDVYEKNAQNPNSKGNGNQNNNEIDISPHLKELLLSQDKRNKS